MTFTVQMVSPCGVRYDLYCGLEEWEANDICQRNHWQYFDENDFEWLLDYVEDREYEDEDEDEDYEWYDDEDDSYMDDSDEVYEESEARKAPVKKLQLVHLDFTRAKQSTSREEFRKEFLVYAQREDC